MEIGKLFAIGLVAFLSACSADMTDSSGARLTQTPNPCQIDRILHTVCQQCHTSPMKNDAPFPLITHEDVHHLIDGKPTYEYMKVALETDRMPLAPAQISAADRQTLLDWLKSGAPARSSTEQCVE